MCIHSSRSRSHLINVMDPYNTPKHPEPNLLLLPQTVSDLTCNNNVSGSRKRRGRDQQSLATTMNQNQNQNQFRYDQQPSRLSDPTFTSISGAHDLYAHLCAQQNIEIDAIIRQHNERVRSEVEESRKRQCRAVMSSMMTLVARRLKEKEAELEMSHRKNAELEENIRQLSAENQVWFDLAKNNEAIASALRSCLEQVARVDQEEGYGDTDGPADDADKDDEARARARSRPVRCCRVCCEKDAGVLLLPCKHLCVCKECESKIVACPVCLRTKDACLQVFMPPS